MIGLGPLSVWIEFGEGVALAIALTSIIIALNRLFDPTHLKWQPFIIGLGFGLIGLAIMLIPIDSLPLVHADARLLPVAVAGLFGGAAATVIASGLVIASHIGLSGIDAAPGVVAVVAAGMLGAVASRLWGEQTKRFNALQYFGFGVAIFVLTVCTFLFLPEHQTGWVMSVLAPPAAVFVPLGTMLVGILMSAEFKRADADAELRRREAQIREVIENSPAAVYLKDPESRYLMVNREFLDRLNLTAHDVIGNTAEDLFSKRDAANIMAQDKAVLTERRARTFEVNTVYPEDDIRAEMVVKFPILGDDGAVAGLGGVSTDITELNQARQAVRQVEKRYREFFEKSELVFLALDKNGKISSCNDYLLSLTGYSRAEVSGGDWFEIFIPKEEREVVRKVFLDTMSTDTVAVPPHFENEIKTKDGALRTISWDNVINHDSDGKIAGVTCVGVDVTERRRALVEIQREKERAEQYLAIAGTIILALDANAAITLINRKGCEVLGYTEAELLGANWINTAIPEEARGQVSEVLGKVMAGEIAPVEGFENEIVTKSGERRLIAWTNSYITDEEGHIVASLSSGEDITDRTRAQDEAQALQERLAQVSRMSTMGEMAAGFAHELNQPLAAINNYAHGALNLLRRGRSNTKELVPALEKLSLQAERAGEVIRRIRWFVQKNAPQKVPTDLNQTIRNAAEFMHSDMIENDIVLNFELAEGLDKIPADAVQIQQVVMNLSRNAIEAMRTNRETPRTLTIKTAESRGSGIEVAVSDTGPGLSPEIEAELFEPFITNKPDGMGIGLSICRSLIQAHGGELCAESVPGEGTTFRFTIPRETNEKDD